MASKLRLGRNLCLIWLGSPGVVSTKFWTIIWIRGSVSKGERSRRASRSHSPVIIFSRMRWDSRAARVTLLSLSYKIILINIRLVLEYKIDETLNQIWLDINRDTFRFSALLKFKYTCIPESFNTNQFFWIQNTHPHVKKVILSQNPGFKEIWHTN